MEGNVWQLFVQVANFLSSLFSSLSNQKNQSNGGALPNAPVKDVALISTSTNVTNQDQNILKIIRNPALATVDALFGTMVYNGKVLGITMERTAVAIPEGSYRGYKRPSAHFHMTVVGIDVPNRTDIECHPANLPSQLLGCIAIGESKDGDALDNSRTAFQRMMDALPNSFTVEVTSLKSTN